jgi:hypothetical protein
MLVLDKKSGLVRLSDAVKTGLGTCSDTSAEVLQCFSKDESLYRAAEKIFDEALGGRVDLKEAHSKIRSTLRPIGDPGHLAYLQTKLHNQALPTVLTCWFILESYINTLASSSLPERALEAFNRISRTLDKWSAFAKVNHGVGFDRSQSPFQDFKILFRFRDDCVHDKLIELSNDRQVSHYSFGPYGTLLSKDCHWDPKLSYEVSCEEPRRVSYGFLGGFYPCGVLLIQMSIALLTSRYWHLP